MAIICFIRCFSQSCSSTEWTWLFNRCSFMVFLQRSDQLKEPISNVLQLGSDLNNMDSNLPPTYDEVMKDLKWWNFTPISFIQGPFVVARIPEKPSLKTPFCILYTFLCNIRRIHEINRAVYIYKKLKFFRKGVWKEETFPKQLEFLLLFNSKVSYE